MIFFSILCFSVSLPTAPPPVSVDCALPDILKVAIDTRMSFQTARIEWSVEPAGRDELFYTTGYAGDERLWVERGDRDGVRVPDRIGQDYSCSEKRHLVKKGEKWTYVEHMAAVYVLSDPPREIPDVRLLGFAPFDTAGVDLCVLFGRGELDYETRSTDEGVEIIARTREGAYFRWVLNAVMGWAPTKVEYVNEAAGKTNTSRTSYREIDGHFFPETVEFDRNGQRERTIHILSASFDRPDHPQTFTLADLGVRPGFNILRGEGKPPFWDGSKEVPYDEFMVRVAKGTFDATEFREYIFSEDMGQFPKSFSGEFLGLTDPQRSPGLWEEYVRRFIRTYRLDDAQTRKAWDIHKSCVQNVRDYDRKHRQEIEELEAKREDARHRQTSAPFEGRFNELNRRQSHILEHTEAVFGKELKPRLIAVLTSEQKTSIRRKTTIGPKRDP